MAEGNKQVNVSTGKPNPQGAIYATLDQVSGNVPTDATAPLHEDFKNLGYVSEDGFTTSTERDSEDIKAWGGDVVLRDTTSFTKTASYTLIECMREDVLKHVYGSAHVTGSLQGGLTVKETAKENPRISVVVEVMLGTDHMKRIVYPVCQVSLDGEITYKDGQAIGYPVTVTAYPDEHGVSAYEYFAKVTKD